MADRVKNLIRRVTIILFWFGIWQILSMLVSRELLLPSPYKTLQTLCALAADAVFWKSVAFSILRIMAGFFAGCAAGALLATLCALSGVASALFRPFLSVVRSTPVASFIVIALVWIGRGAVPSFIAFLIVLPIVCDSVLAGMKNADSMLLEVAQIYAFSKPQRIRLILIPGAMKSFLSSSATALGIAWKAGIAAEVLATPQHSIGTSLYQAKIYLESPELLAWTMTIIILSMAFEKVLHKGSTALLHSLHLGGVK